MNTVRPLPPVSILLAALIVLAGCQMTPTVSPPAPLDLVDSAPLAIADHCEVPGAVLVEYTILESGETGNIEVSSAPDCARDALSAWVASYRYSPQPADISTRFEWILVSARRGT